MTEPKGMDPDFYAFLVNGLDQATNQQLVNLKVKVMQLEMERGILEAPGDKAKRILGTPTAPGTAPASPTWLKAALRTQTPWEQARYWANLVNNRGIGAAARVRLTEGISPKYLVGREGVLEHVGGKTAKRFMRLFVRLDNPPTTGRFPNPMWIPATCIEVFA